MRLKLFEIVLANRPVTLRDIKTIGASTFDSGFAEIRNEVGQIGGTGGYLKDNCNSTFPWKIVERARKRKKKTQQRSQGSVIGDISR